MRDATHPTDKSPLIFISAAEPSADLHGASLIRATLRSCPEARFVGIAGPKMVAAGCDAMFDMTAHSAMLLGAIKAVGRGIRLLRTSDRLLRRFPFDAAVVIDSPTLHLPLAAQAHALAVPVLYYIAPQLWAWGAYRIHKLRNRTDRVAVILPFEERYFRDQGVEATYVGHPLAEQWADTRIDQDTVEQIRSGGSPVVALLPGSRKHVVQSVLGGQLEVAAQIAGVFPNASFGVSVANRTVGTVIDAMLGGSSQGRPPGNTSHHEPGRAGPPGSVQPVREHQAEWIAAADLVLVASGTATLQVAFQRRPMIVMYKGSRPFYHLIGRWLIHTPYLSLPNILAGREIVPEFMPYYTSTAPIAERAIDLLHSEDARRTMIGELEEVVKPLRSTRASEKTAAMLLSMIGLRR